MFFEKTDKYNLKQYFDRNCSDVRVRLRELYQRTKETIAKERDISLEVVLLIGCLEAKNAAVNLMRGRREDLASSLGLTPNMYWKRAQAGRVLLNYPEFIDLITQGKTYISHIAILAPKITQANKQVFLDQIEGKSERQTRELAAAVNRDGTINDVEPITDIRLSLTKAQIHLLERSREVLSAAGKVPSDEEVFIKALEDLLAKRDPMQKADRAEARARKKANVTSAKKEGEQILNIVETPSLKKKADISVASSNKGREHVPAHIRHRVYLRDGGRCSHTDENGWRCPKTATLQIDHVVPVALGGSNDLNNLRLLCREHNISEGVRLLGEQTMNQYRHLQPTQTNDTAKTSSSRRVWRCSDIGLPVAVDPQADAATKALKKDDLITV